MVAVVVAVDRGSGEQDLVEVVKMEARADRHDQRRRAKQVELMEEEEEVLDIHRDQLTVARVVKLARMVAYHLVMMGRVITGRMQPVDQPELKYKDLLGI